MSATVDDIRRLFIAVVAILSVDFVILLAVMCQIRDEARAHFKRSNDLIEAASDLMAGYAELRDPETAKQVRGEQPGGISSLDR